MTAYLLLRRRDAAYHHYVTCKQKEDQMYFDYYVLSKFKIQTQRIAKTDC